MIQKSIAPSGAETLEVKEKDLEKINQYTIRKFTSKELFVFRVVLCNNDLDRDGECFTLDTLKGMARLYLGKTGLFDHSMQSRDQHARIFETYVEEETGRLTKTGEAFYRLVAKAYMPKTKENAALMQEIEAGIKKEVSVGCAVEKTVCSICGADFSTAPCRHVPGKRYEGKLCCRLLKTAKDAYEWSFVAVPAQPEAGVIKTFGGKEAREDAVYLSRSELLSLQKDAEAGRNYRERLCREVGALCAIELPQMDMEVFRGIVKTMTVEELHSFRKAFGGGETGGSFRPQLKKGEGASPDNEVFKI